MIQKRKRIAAIMIMALLSTMVLCAYGATVTKAPAKAQIIAFEHKLNQEVPELLKKHKVPGIAIGLVHQGRVEWVQGYGTADKTVQKPVTSDTVFQAASISKSFTAWGVMKLVEQGKIDLDAPVEKYLTRWHLPKSEYNDQVTIRKILSHTAGLSGVSYKGYSPDEKQPTIEQSLSGEAGIPALKVVRQPGQAFGYTGAGYTLLQLVIEEVTGQTFSQYMQSEILAPLGLQDSGFELDEERYRHSAKGHGPLGSEMPAYRYTEKAAAGLYTTAYDLAAFTAAAMKTPGGEAAGRGILSPDTIAQMQERTKTASGQTFYGLGYYIPPLTEDEKMVAHDGTNRGWSSQIAMLPNKGEGIVMLTNSDMGSLVIREVWGYWLEMQVGVDPGFGRGVRASESKMAVVALAIFTGLLFYLERVVGQVKSGRRKLIRKVSLRNVSGLLMPLVLLCGWRYLVYEPWFNGWSITPYLPAGIGWVNGIFVVWMLILVGAGVVPKERRDRKRRNVDITI